MQFCDTIGGAVTVMAADIAVPIAADRAAQELPVSTALSVNVIYLFLIVI